MASKKEPGKDEGKPKGKPAKRKRPPKAARRARKRAKKVEEFLNYRQVQALSKKERVRVLAIFCERIASPLEISKELGEGLGHVSYHVKVLERCGLIVLDHEVPRRGAVEHFYRATFPTEVPTDFWAHLPPALRKAISVDILQRFTKDASASIEAGVFDGPPGELCWTPLVLDSPGVEEFGKLSRDFLDAVVELQAKVNARAPKRGRKASRLTSATVFLASFLSARSPKVGKKASAAKRL